MSRFQSDAAPAPRKMVPELNWLREPEPGPPLAGEPGVRQVAFW